MRQLLFLGCFLASCVATGQAYTRKDSLRGGLRPERTCFDVGFYDLDLKLDIAEKTIGGTVRITYRAVRNFKKLQLDLFDQFEIQSITQKGKNLRFTRDSNAVFVAFPKNQREGKIYTIEIAYSGHPLSARMPPWDGGFVWKKAPDGSPFVSVACQHLGASSWWPCKDHPSDEPDSLKIACAVPAGLTCVSSGNLRNTQILSDGSTRFTWFVSYPINLYGVAINVAKYAHFQDIYTAQDGEKLALDYYVLPQNLEKAKAQFQQVKPMLACYERYLGKYPFWRDGYALVETPYLGMEHQSAVTYGNGYKNGYQGSDFYRSGGIGLTFDFIIIHESGHEYFANSISCADEAELWIHESFTTYLETLYLECTQGYPVAVQYLQAQMRRCANNAPLVSPLGVNADTPGDIYHKGSVMLHTLRGVVGDSAWFPVLKKFTENFKYKIVDTPTVMDFFSKETGQDLRPIFRQYLYQTQPPRLEYKYNPESKHFSYRWAAEEPGFSMPVRMAFGTEAYQTLHATTAWQSVSTADGTMPKFGQEWAYFITKKAP